MSTSPPHKNPNPSEPHQDEDDDLARSILSSIQSNQEEEDDLSFLLRLSSTFPETTLFSGLTLCRVVDLSPSTATSMRFLRWVAMRPCADFDNDASTLPLLVRLFVDRGDLDAAHDVVLLFRYAAGRSSLRAMLVILIEAFSEQQRHPVDVASMLIGRMSHDKSFYPLDDSIVAGVSALHDLSFVDEAVALVKDQFLHWVSTMLSWEDQRNNLVDNGKRIAAEFAKEGLPKAATTAYNVILESELTNGGRGFDVILAEMDDMGIIPDIGTFNIIAAYHDKASSDQSHHHRYYYNEEEEPAVMISSDDAVRLHDEMIRRGCKPDLEMYFITARLLFRKGEGSRAREMIDRAQSSIGIAFDAKSCHKFMMESCDHGMVELSRRMLEVMEGNGCVPMLETYLLLISRLVMDSRLEIAIDMYHRALKQHSGLLRLNLKAKVDEVLRGTWWGESKDPSLDFSKLVLKNNRDHIRDFPPPMVPDDKDDHDSSSLKEEDFWEDSVFLGFRDHIELAYQDLCTARGRFLHSEANIAFPIVLEAYIRVIVRITWGVRSVTASAPLSELDSWIRSLEGMESDGMDVGFLIERIKNLREMVDAYQRDEIASVDEQRGDHDHECKSRFHSLNGKAKMDLHRLMGRLMLSKGNALAESISEMALARW
ncbi:hypothetical protein QJS10_CPA10g01840 [Acorus calamus]|uniref:Pentatricopeptide repeat-containing protein n=1 Tax=Acorus calamus TaxID=4465 RepID=A0AAV9E1H7_ACOCL|nr:hypothetical protein QJS10_CPA10g01840 [Acorus calamus]